MAVIKKDGFNENLSTESLIEKLSSSDTNSNIETIDESDVAIANNGEKKEKEDDIHTKKNGINLLKIEENVDLTDPGQNVKSQEIELKPNVNETSSNRKLNGMVDNKINDHVLLESTDELINTQPKTTDKTLSAVNIPFDITNSEKESILLHKGTNEKNSHLETVHSETAKICDDEGKSQNMKKTVTKCQDSENAIVEPVSNVCNVENKENNIKNEKEKEDGNLPRMDIKNSSEVPESTDCNQSSQLENKNILPEEKTKLCIETESSDHKENLETDVTQIDEKVSNVNETTSLEKNNLEKRQEMKNPYISKLSNTLDILSDDEDIENEDDDITSKASAAESIVALNDNNDAVAKREDTDPKVEMAIENIPTSGKDMSPPRPNGVKVIEENIAVAPKPLLPPNFLDTCKKNFAEMTRNELEELFILKIVEGVVDRGNLGEIKSQLKKMTLCLEEHRNRVKMLTKQNQDLQVVLRSVQEELRKNSPITPLKITRSVGIQVIMAEKSKRKPPLSQSNNPASTGANKPQVRSPVTPSNRQQKQPNTAQIPYPRLVPAKNSTNTTVSNQITNVKATPPSRPPILKPEKRPLIKGQASSDTVDLTDDEPPLKVSSRPVNQAVRVVPQQNLMPPVRPQVGNNSRKVYIPIGEEQTGNIRPGPATYMIKTVNTQNVRPRNPQLRKSHPPPLPESSKQYQPPNWKAIPPAPEITLAKVENGIVISWKIDNFREEYHESIATYQIYAYQETQYPPSTNLWKIIGNVKALPLPMACTLTQFVPGFKYYFAVRAVDVRSRHGSFSTPGNILLLNK
ncbi:unnamed protein product [Leptosia nina]|uniref:Activating transcription factor 7-interacting protein Fn3 domain-containing protein n=1 Tax=Leptosia nina TaxID=320188 RepID=A0AAV1J630_9NEOP